mmetsp:Transcript_6363/g.12388  ORF Transcript_6363/g.12388 Transcript_6363/m.12388 type:complete len:210 (-) Transcript_6363:482-1111(-)
MRLTITSNVAPRCDPSKWISSMMTKPTPRTYPLACHWRLVPSHFSGVVMMMSAAINALRSGVKSPVNSTSFKPSLGAIFSPQPSTRSRTNAFKGATYTTFIPGCAVNNRIMASSALTVFPDPVGAPNKTFASEWYNAWKACVWMGLKCENWCSYSDSYNGFRNADLGSGSKSSNSVCGRVRPGRVRWLNVTTAEDEAPSQSLLTQRAIY